MLSFSTFSKFFWYLLSISLIKFDFNSLSKGSWEEAINASLAIILEFVSAFNWFNVANVDLSSSLVEVILFSTISSNSLSSNWSWFSFSTSDNELLLLIAFTFAVYDGSILAINFSLASLFAMEALSDPLFESLFTATDEAICSLSDNVVSISAFNDIKSSLFLRLIALDGFWLNNSSTFLDSLLIADNKPLSCWINCEFFSESLRELFATICFTLSS